MATSAAAADYLTSRPVIRTRTSVTATPPRTPRTPLLGRSISSGLGSPSLFRSEQEDVVVYEITARHLSVGFSGESRPRCTVWFDPNLGRRAGDFRQYLLHDGSSDSRVSFSEPDWTRDHELFTNNVRELDLGLVKDKFERTVRQVHLDVLQLDSKPRKISLVVPSMLPIPLLDVILQVFFLHSAQLPSITLLPAPIMNCVGAGLRDAIVIDLGWQETVVTAVGEYKEIFEQRTVRGGKLVLQEMAKMLESVAHADIATADLRVSLKTAQEVLTRMGWCRSNEASELDDKNVTVPLSGSHSITLAFARLAEPIELALFKAEGGAASYDDHESLISELVYRVLLKLSLDFRSTCLSRIVVTGGMCHIPGLKRRLLTELQHLIESRGWDPVQSYGSVSDKRRRIPKKPFSTSPTQAASSAPTEASAVEEKNEVRASEKAHDDEKDPISIKAERRLNFSSANAQDVTSPRMAATVGAWAGASLISHLRIKGVHEIEREEYVKHGLREFASVII